MLYDAMKLYGLGPNRMEKERDATALATITMRLREPLRAQIEASAKAKGTSMNSEMVDRLNRSFMFDQLLGKWQAIKLWADVVGQAEKRASRRASELEIDGDWSGDPDCFREAMLSAIRRLLQLFPGELDDEVSFLIEEMFKHALLAEQNYRKGILPGGFIEHPAEDMTSQ